MMLDPLDGLFVQEVKPQGILVGFNLAQQAVPQ
jgi:hypothetical protein